MEQALLNIYILLIIISRSIKSKYKKWRTHEAPPALLWPPESSHLETPNPLLQGHFHSPAEEISLRTQPNFPRISCHFPLYLPARFLHSCSSQTQQGLSSDAAGIQPSSHPTPSIIWGFSLDPPSLPHFFPAIKISVQREARIHLWTSHLQQQELSENSETLLFI